MLKVAQLTFTDDLAVEFVPTSAANPLLDYLNRLTMERRGNEGVRYVGYAYEYDAREPDYLIFAVNHEGERREYLVPVTHSLGLATGRDCPVASELRLNAARAVMSRPQYPEACTAIFAPHISWNEDVPAAALRDIRAFMRRQRDETAGYVLTCAPDTKMAVA
jgi:hypothetical protein